jgi:hypothetical protein
MHALITVILSDFRRTRTVPKSFRTKLKLFLKIHWEHSTYRTIVLFLKTRIFLKKYHKIMRILRYFIVFFKETLFFKNNFKFL